MYQIINTKENWIIAICNSMAEAGENILSYYEADKRLNCFEAGIYKIIKTK